VDYFLMPFNAPRTFYDEAGTPVTRFQLVADGPYRLRLVQSDGFGVWWTDWILRVEIDGSLTELGDEYPVSSRLDMFSGKRSRVYFLPGHEIRWADSETGTIWPNPIKTSPSKLGSFGTFLVKSLLQKDGTLDIYMEQTFGRKDRSVYHCRKGHGIYAITYIEPDGNSVTITEQPAGEANPAPAV
jgi:hypothetical protein